MPPKKFKPQKMGKNAKSMRSPVTVNKPQMKYSAAPAALGADFQTYVRESRMQRKYKGELKDAVVIEGCEYLGPVQVPAEEVPGAAYMEIYIAPGEFAGTRLSLYSRLYEKFVFENLDFMYVPAVGSEVAGQLVIAHDRDISDSTPPASQQGVRQYLSMEDAKAGNVWQPHTAKCPLRAPEDGFFTNPVTGGDDRLAYQGQTYVACVVPSGLAEGATLGTLLMRYKCVFFIPQLENELAITTVLADADTSAPLPVLNNDLDLFGQIITGTPLGLSGPPQWVPKLQADGTYAITLPEGLYSLLSSLTGLTGFFPAPGVLTAIPLAPTIEVLEPAAPPAPQAAVEPYLQTSASADAGSGTSPLVGTPVWQGYLNIPRGGARLRQRLRVTNTSGPTATVDPGPVALTLTRLGSVVQSLLNIVPAPSPEQVRQAEELGFTRKEIKAASAFTLRRMIAERKPVQTGAAVGNDRVPAATRGDGQGACTPQVPGGGIAPGWQSPGVSKGALSLRR
jgi:hypothetical protein